MSLILVTVCLFSICENVAMAQSAGEFSRIGFGARGIALGNALAADAMGPASPYYNPALAPFAKQQSLDISIAALSFDRSLQFIQLASPMQKAGIAFGLIHSSVGKIDGRDNSGFHTRDLSIDEYQGFLAFGIRFTDKFSGGLDFQLFRTDLFDTLEPAVSIAIDIGWNYRVSETLSLAFVVDDLLGRYTWKTGGVNGGEGKTTTDYFPTRLRLGVAKSLSNGALLIVGEIESRTLKVESVSSRVDVFDSRPVEGTNRDSLTLHEIRARIGAEYFLVPQFVLRAGLEQLGSEILSGFRPSAGFMVSQDVGSLKSRFEYTFAREVEASGSMHVFALLLFF
jgi:hypothetical protein